MEKLSTGEYSVEVHCPTCGAVADIPAIVEAVVKRKETGGGTLGLALTSKPAPHDCSTRQLMIDANTGEVIA